MIKGMATLLLFQFVGEAVTAFLHLPLSGPIMGMALLLVWLQARGGAGDSLAAAADGLLANMAVLFVPVGVGIMVYHDLFRRHWLFVAASMLVATLAVIAVTALVAKVLMQLRQRPVRPPEAAARRTS
jgi:holin-like protein